MLLYFSQASSTYKSGGCLSKPVTNNYLLQVSTHHEITCMEFPFLSQILSSTFSFPVSLQFLHT